ncbi:MAG: hypothetical protein AAGJ54_12945, partial [Planctomycetota bacterium]
AVLGVMKSRFDNANESETFPIDATSLSFARPKGTARCRANADLLPFDALTEFAPRSPFGY